jgi:hypothetical protein
MRIDHRRWLYRAALVAAATSAGLFVLTLVDPTWIETLFDEAPDGGDGSLERWILLGCTFVATVIAALLARAEKRRLQAAAPGR